MQFSVAIIVQIHDAPANDIRERHNVECVFSNQQLNTNIELT